MPKLIVWKSARDEDNPSRLLDHISVVTDVAESDGCVTFVSERGHESIADRADILRICDTPQEVYAYLGI